jgi:hypothetical protein
LELLDPVEFPEGTAVLVTLRAVSAPKDREAFQRAAGGWKGTVDVETLMHTIYADRLLSTRPAPGP